MVLAFGDAFDAGKLARRSVLLSSTIALSISEPAGVETDLSWAPERAPGPHRAVLRPRGGIPSVRISHQCVGHVGVCCNLQGQMSTQSSSCALPVPSGARPPAPGPSSRVICVSYHRGVNSTSPSWKIHGTKHPSMRPVCAAAHCCCEEALILLLDAFGLCQG